MRVPRGSRFSAARRRERTSGSGGEDRPSFAHAPAPRRFPEKLPMNPILLFLLTTAGAFLLHIVMIFVLVGKKK